MRKERPVGVSLISIFFYTIGLPTLASGVSLAFFAEDLLFRLLGLAQIGLALGLAWAGAGLLSMQRTARFQAIALSVLCLLVNALVWWIDINNHHRGGAILAVLRAGLFAAAIAYLLQASVAVQFTVKPSVDASLSDGPTVV